MKKTRPGTWMAATNKVTSGYTCAQDITMHVLGVPGSYRLSPSSTFQKVMVGENPTTHVVTVRLPEGQHIGTAGAIVNGVSPSTTEISEGVRTLYFYPDDFGVTRISGITFCEIA